MSVFVHLVGYGNSDVVQTIRDCIENSADKSNLHFGVCLQQDEDIPSEIVHPRIKVHRVPRLESRGPGWARSVAQAFYDGQDYQMQINSWSRFAEGWDEKLISALGQTGSSKPLITNYPNKYNKSTNEKEQPDTAYRSQIYQIFNDTPMAWPAPMKGIATIVPSKWINENFFFSRGSHCADVKADPELYYSELESSVTVRSFCAGYDMFNHFVPIVWKNYEQIQRNWNEDPEWWLKDNASKKRMGMILDGIVGGEFGLSSFRSLRDFELYSGVDLKNKRLQKSTVSGENPPCKYENEEQWEGEYLKDHALMATWNTDEIERCDDYDYWYFAVEDEAGNAINRQDLRQDYDADLLQFKSNFKKIYFKAPSNAVPKSIAIQPVSKSKGWLKKVKFDL
jgi:hypothetical protein